MIYKRFKIDYMRVIVFALHLLVCIQMPWLIAAT